MTLLTAGEPVLLIDRKKRRYLVDLEAADPYGVRAALTQHGIVVTLEKIEFAADDAAGGGGNADVGIRQCVCYESSNR